MPAGECVCENGGAVSRNVRISKGGKLFNGKSMVSVLSACVKCDTMIEVICDGEREEEALAAIVQAVESGLGE